MVKICSRYNDKNAIQRPDRQLDNIPLDLTKFICYEKRNYDHELVTEGVCEYVEEWMCGMVLEEGLIYINIGFNKFKSIPIEIPSDFKIANRLPSVKYIKERYCDPNRTLLKEDNEEYKNIKSNLYNYESYPIHDNGGRPFLVYVGEDELHIYKQDNIKYYIDYNDEDNDEEDNDEEDNDEESNSVELTNTRFEKKWMYISHVASYKFNKIFIGKSPLTKSTEFSGGSGPEFDGNSILAELDYKDSEYSYLYIGSIIRTFNTDDRIVKYWSIVGNNDVPYPVAIGEQNYYFMLDMQYVELDKFTEWSKDIEMNGYSYYYGHSGDAWDRKVTKPKPIKSYTIVNERIF